MSNQTLRHQGRIVLLSTVLCTQLVSCGGLSWASSGELISQTELIEQIEAGTAPVILDVRTVEEYEAGHIQGAINIHFREITDRLDEIPRSVDGTIVVYCERGIRANVAEETLRAAGFETVLNLEGDMVAWRKQKLPMIRNTVSK